MIALLWSETELRTWVKDNMGRDIPDDIRVRVMKWADAGNYMLYAYDTNYAECSQFLYHLASIIRRAGGYTFLRLSDDKFNQWATLEIDMRGTQP